MGQTGLLKTKKFAPLFWTQFLGAFNDNFLKNALILLILYKSTTVLGVSSNDMVPLSGALFIFPFFIFSATAGQLADKYEKSRLIRWIKTAEVGIMMVATMGFVTSQFALLLLCLFLMGLHSTFFGPIKYSILPQHLASSELVGGNALIEAGTVLAILLGTLAGGVLIALPQGPLYVSVGLLLFALIGLGTSRFIPLAPPVDDKLVVQWNPIKPTWQIFKFTQQTRPVYLSILGISWFWFFGSAILLTLPAYCKNDLNTNENVVTFFLAVFCVGSGLGSLLCEKLSRKRLELGLVPLGSIGISTFAFLLFFEGAPRFGTSNQLGTIGEFIHSGAGVGLSAALFGLALFSGIYIVPLFTLVQERSAPAYRSRIIAGNNILNSLFMVASSLLLMFFNRLHLTVPQVFLILGLMNLAVAIYIYTVLPEFMMRFIMWILANLLYKLKVKGEGAIPDNGAAVLVCNHITFIDWMIISAGVKRPIRFIMDHNFAKGWLLKGFLRQTKVILIAPAKENPVLLEQAFQQAAAELRDGELVCIFPEGKLTSTGEMNPFKPGIERLIRETPVPVVPMALRGLWGSLFSREGGRAFLKAPRRFWARIELEIGQPVAAPAVTADTLFKKVADLRGNKP